MSPVYHIMDFWKHTASGSSTKFRAAAQSLGAHVPSEMPPLPQLPRITASEPQQRRKVKYHHRTLHLHLTRKMSMTRKKRERNHAQNSKKKGEMRDSIGLRLQTNQSSSCILSPRPAHRRRALWCCRLALVLCSSNRPKLLRKTGVLPIA